MKKKTTAIKTATAPSKAITLKGISDPMNSTASSATSVSCAAFAPTVFGSRIGVYLQKHWLRLARLRTAPSRIRIRIKWIIAWLNRYALNIALIIAVFALFSLLVFINWLVLTSPEHIAISKAQEAYFDKDR